MTKWLFRQKRRGKKLWLLFTVFSFVLIGQYQRLVWFWFYHNTQMKRALIINSKDLSTNPSSFLLYITFTYWSKGSKHCTSEVAAKFHPLELSFWYTCTLCNCLSFWFSSTSSCFLLAMVSFWTISSIEYLYFSVAASRADSSIRRKSR